MLMSTTRILWTLLLTGTLALAATGTQAQSIAHSDQSHERQEASSDEYHKLGRPWGIVGSWFGTTATGIRQLITFHADGTVLRSVPAKSAPTPHVRRTPRPMASGATSAWGGSA
jgi:hypothetical protein